jgi:hypothetical protein
MAMDFLTPYVLGEKKWPYKQIAEYNNSTIAHLMAIASAKYRVPQYEQMAQKIDPTVSSNIECLIAKFTKK